MGLLIFALVNWLVAAGFAAALAEAKARNGIAWFFGTLLFGPFALVALVGMPVDEVAEARRRIDEGDAVVCSECGELMRPWARICPHCRSPRALELVEQQAEGRRP